MSSADEINEAELLRYVQHLQRQMLTADMGAFFDHAAHLEWMTKPGGDALQHLSRVYLGAQLESLRDQVETFRPATEFDTFSSRQIFGSILEEVSASATELGFGLERPIVLHGSTEIAPSPSVLPSSTVHIIFAGAATSTFCNYWGKVLARLAIRLARKSRGSATQDSVLLALREDTGIVALASRLAAHYAFTGTALGFGTVEFEFEEVPLRAEYVHAMEVFIVAHEYAHCYMEERFEQCRGFQSPASSIELETACDLIACSVTQAYGAQLDSWSAFCNAGAFLFFLAMNVCEQARVTLGGGLRAPASDHPPIDARLEIIRGQTLRATAEDQRDSVAAYLHDLQVIFECLATVVGDVLTRIRPELDPA